MKKVLTVAAITATMLAVGTGAYAATYVNGEDVTNEVFTTISNDYTRCAIWEKSLVAM